MCRALRHRADVRTSTTTSATWLLESAFFRCPSPTYSPLASSLRSTQLFLLDLVLGWAWYFNSGGTCVDHGTASQAVVQKSAMGPVQWVPNQEMMSHIIFFLAGDNALTRPHHDTSTGITSSTASSFKGTFSTSHRTGTWSAPPPSRPQRICCGLLSAREDKTLVSCLAPQSQCLDLWVRVHLGIQRQVQMIQKVQRTVEFQQARCMDRIIEIFVHTILHCHGRLFTSSCRTGRQGGVSMNLEISQSSEMPGMSARVHAQFTRSELSSYQMTHAGGPALETTQHKGRQTVEIVTRPMVAFELMNPAPSSTTLCTTHWYRG